MNATGHEGALRELRRRFPGVCLWFGESTRHWWAVVRDRWGRSRLVEAATPAALGRLLQEDDASQRWRPPRDEAAKTGAVVRAAPRPRAAAPSRRRGGRHARPRSGWSLLAA